jgi:hypothetical protein
MYWVFLIMCNVSLFVEWKSRRHEGGHLTHTESFPRAGASRSEYIVRYSTCSQLGPKGLCVSGNLFAKTIVSRLIFYYNLFCKIFC